MRREVGAAVRAAVGTAVGGPGTGDGAGVGAMVGSSSLRGARHVMPCMALGTMTPCQKGGHWVTPRGAMQRPLGMRSQPPGGQGGTRAHTTPAVAVASAMTSNGPVGHCVVLAGAWQPPKLPLERVTMGQLGGHMVASMVPLSTGAETGERVRDELMVVGGARHKTAELAAVPVVDQPAGHVVTPAGDWHCPPAMRVQPPAGQDGSAAHTTPAVDVACSTRLQGPGGHWSTVNGASQVLWSSARHSGGQPPEMDLNEGLGLGMGLGLGLGLREGLRDGLPQGARLATGLRVRSRRHAHVTPRVAVLGRLSRPQDGQLVVPRMGPWHRPLGSSVNLVAQLVQRIVWMGAGDGAPVCVGRRVLRRVGALVAPDTEGAGVGRTRDGVQVTPPRERLAGTLTRQPVGQVRVLAIGAWQRTPVCERPDSRRQRRGQPVLGSSACTQTTPRVVEAGRTRDQAKGQTRKPTGAAHWRTPAAVMIVVQLAMQRPMAGVGARLVDGRTRRVGRLVRVGVGLPSLLGPLAGELDGGSVYTHGTSNGILLTMTVQREAVALLATGHATSTYLPPLEAKHLLPASWTEHADEPGAAPKEAL